MENAAQTALDQGRAPGAVAATSVWAARLTDRQARYVELRALGKRPYLAGIGAGLTPAAARRITAEWERDPRIVEAIAAAGSEAAVEAKVTPADVMRELAILAFSTLDDYEIDAETGMVRPADEAPEYVMRAVKRIVHRKIVSGNADDGYDVEYRTEIQLWDKPAALKMIGEVMGLFLKRIRVEDDDETKAALGALRGIMQKALDRQAGHAVEEASIDAFRKQQAATPSPDHVNALANAGAAVLSSGHPLDALRALARTVTPTPEGRSDADTDGR